MTLIHKRRWAGTIYSFVLFIAAFIIHNVCLSTSAPATGNMDLGMLFFILPGIVASLLSRRSRFFKPLLGAILATPVCLAAMKVWSASNTGVVQEMAWLFSAVFWSALGALGTLFFISLLRHQDAKKRRL